MRIHRIAITVAIYFLFMALFTNSSKDQIMSDENILPGFKKECENQFMESKDEEQSIVTKSHKSQKHKRNEDSIMDEQQMLMDEQPMVMDENKTNIHKLDNINAQSIQQNEQPIKFFDAIKTIMHSPLLYQLLTIDEILILQSTCNFFRKLLFPNKKNLMMYVQLLLLQHEGDLNEDVMRDMEQKFGTIGLQTQQLYEFLYLEKKDYMNWFFNLNQYSKDNVVHVLFQSIEHYRGFNENVARDIEQKFGIITSQTNQLYEFLNLEKKERMDWLHIQDQQKHNNAFQLVFQSIQHYVELNEDIVIVEEKESMYWFYILDQRDKDSAVQHLAKNIKQYHELTENVMKDMEKNFSMNALQTHQLYEFLYLKKDENKTNIYDLYDVIAQNFQQDVLQLTLNDEKLDNDITQNLQQNFLSKPVSTIKLLHVMKGYILDRIVYEYLTIHELLILRKSCADFRLLLYPNENNMVMICNYYGYRGRDVQLMWFDLKYFLNESHANSLENNQMLNLKQNQYTILTHDEKIISWYNEQTQELYHRIQFYKNTNKILHAPLAQIYNKCEKKWTKITNEANKSFGGGDAYFLNHVQSQLNNIKMMVKTDAAFAVLFSDGRVVAFGHQDYGGKIPDLIQPHLKNVKAIFSSRWSFAALLYDGSVFSWGDEHAGGEIPNHIKTKLHQNVKMIFSNDEAFVCLLKNGDFIAWGNVICGGQIDLDIQTKLRSVTVIFSSSLAFAALLEDGSVITWGSERHGGGKIPDEIQEKLIKNVKMIFPQRRGFTVLCNNGEIIKLGEEF